LPPGRIAALRKWLHAANTRLLSMERTRRELIAAATEIADGARLARQPKRKRAKLAARL
jgi:hypothetical protein